MSKIIELGIYNNPKSIDKLKENFEEGDTVIVAGFSGFMYLEKNNAKSPIF